MAAASPYMWRPRLVPTAGTSFLPSGAAVPSGRGAGLPHSAGLPDVTEIYHLRYEEVGVDGLSSQVVQRVFRLRTTLGAQIFGGDEFWYDSSRWTFHLVRAAVLHADGSVARGKDGGDSDPEGLGNRARDVALPPLRAGDLVDVVYHLAPVANGHWRELGTGYLGDIFAFRGNYPLELGRYVLRSRQPLATRGVGVRGSRTGPDAAGWRTWIWTAGPLPAFWTDGNGPSITDSSPYVQTGEFAQWGELAAWYAKKLRRRADLTPAFRARLRRLVPPRRNAWETTRAVWDYLSRRLSYQGRETGAHGFLPAAPAAVLRAEAGDCKDGALLLATWLRADGVPADVALIRTWPMGTVADGAATMSAFDHAIVYVPSLRLWIDTTAPDLPLGLLPASDQGARALLAAAGQNGLVRVPIAAAAVNATSQSLTLAPACPGRWLMTGVINAKGAEALKWRRRLGRNPRVGLAAWARRQFPRIEVQKAALSAGADGELRASFKALVARDQPVDSVALFSRYYTPLLAAERSRRQSLRVPLRWEVTDSWRIPAGPETCPAAAAPNAQSVATTDLPPAGTAARQPAGAGGGDVGEPAANTVVSPYGRLAVARTCTDGWLTTTVRLSQDATEVPANDYAQFRAFWRAVDARLHPTTTAPARAVELASADAPAPAPTSDAVAGRRPKATDQESATAMRGAR